MSPKAYDEEPSRNIRARDPDDVLAPEDSGEQAVFAPLRNISLGEALTVATLLYGCTIAAFNAAYFANVPGSFVEFFSLTDLIQTNIPIIQYFISLTLFYLIFGVVISFISGVTGFDVRQAVKDLVEPLVIDYHLNGRRFWVTYAILVLLFYLTDGLLQRFGVTDFTVVMLPTIFFQGILLYFFWVGYKFRILPAKMLAIASLIALFVSSHNAGNAWIKSQIASPSKVQTIQDKDGLCIERTIMRSSSSGLLLYSLSMKQFEFRSKDGFKTIYDGRGCI